MRTLLLSLALATALLTGGCRKSQPEVCGRLIRCAEALIPGANAELQKAYGPEGNCWKSGESADACTRSCTEALEGLRSNPKFADTPACR